MLRPLLSKVGKTLGMPDRITEETVALGDKCGC